MKEQLFKTDRQERTPKKSPIFIVGMPRSGTTLVTSKLSSHSNISIAPESHFLNYWMQRFTPESLDSKEGFSKFWEAFTSSERFQYFEIESSVLLSHISTIDQFKAKSLFSNLLQLYAQQNKKPRWGEKTPAHYAHIERLLEWYPNARIIYMVRDPRAVAASMKKVPWGGKRVIAYALRWNDSIEKLRNLGNDSRILVIQYENFVRSPESSMRSICSFINECYQSKMLETQTSPIPTKSLYSSDWSKSHLSSASKPVNSDSLVRWKEVLSSEEVALIDYLCGEKMEDFSYEPSSISLGKLSIIRTRLYVMGKTSNSFLKKRLKISSTNRKWA